MEAAVTGQTELGDTVYRGKSRLDRAAMAVPITSSSKVSASHSSCCCRRMWVLVYWMV